MRRRIFVSWLGVTFMSFIFAFAFGVYGVYRLAPYYQKTLANILSNITQTSVGLNVSNAGWDGFNPIIEVKNINLRSKQLKLELDKVKLKVKLWQSILYSHLITQDVTINKPKIRIITSSGGNFNLDFISSTALTNIGNSWASIVNYLSTQRNFKINGLQVALERGDNVRNFSIDAVYKSEAKNDNVGEFNIEVSDNDNNKNMKVTAFLHKSKKGYVLKSNIGDKSHILSSVINYYNDTIKLTDKFFSLSTTTSGDVLSSASINGSLLSISYKKPKSNIKVLSNVRFDLQFMSDSNEISIFMPKLSFDHNNRNLSLKKVSLRLVGKRLTTSVPYINLSDFGWVIRSLEPYGQKFINISGVVKNFSLSYLLSHNNLHNISLQADVLNVGVAHSLGKFDFSGLTGGVAWENDKINMSLNSPSFKLGKNEVFTNRWPVLAVKSDLSLYLSDMGIDIQVPSVILKTNKFRYKGNAFLDIPYASPKDFTLKVKGHLSGHDLTTEYKSFLPKHGIPIKLYKWLMKCIYGAKGLEADVDIDGVARHIPFYKYKNSTFKIKAKINGGTLSPYFNFGRATAVNGVLEFDNEKMETTINSGMIGDMPVNMASIKIGNIAAGVPSYMQVKANGSTNTINLKNYIATTKLQPHLSRIKQYVDYDGNLNFNFDFTFPLGYKHKEMSLIASIDTNNGILFITTPMGYKTLYNVRGQVNLDNDNISLNNIHGLFADGNRIDITGKASFTDNNLDFDTAEFNLAAKGYLPQDILWKTQHWYDLFSNYSQFKAGVPFSLSLIGNKSKGDFNFHSDLDSFETSVDTPYSFQYQSHRPVKLNGLWLKNHNGWRVKSNLKIADKVSLQGKLDYMTKSNSMDNLLLTGNVSNLNFSGLIRWESFLHGDMSAFSSIENYLVNSTPVRHSFMLKGSCMLSDDYYDCVYRNWAANLKLNADIDFKNISMSGVKYTKLTLQSRSDKDHTRVRLNGLQKKRADINIPFNKQSPMQIELTNVSIPSNELKNSGISSSASFGDPSIIAKIPKLIAKGTNITVGGYMLPSFLLSTYFKSGVLYIPVLSLSDPVTKIIGSASLSLDKSSININAYSKNWGNLLQNLTYNNMFKDGQGYVDADLDWDGVYPNISSLSGKASINIFHGSLLSVNVGLAKYIGLLSLDSYFKRLFLSSKDFSQSGLPFTHLSGKYSIRGGVAKSTSPVVIETPSFALVVDGSVDLNTHQIYQTIHYQPHFSGTSAAFAGFLGGPVVGFATYFGTKILGNTLFKDTGVVSYKVSGSWDDPALVPQ